MTQTLDEISIILIYSAMAVYALAFIAFALDLARRSSTVKAVAAETSPELAVVGADAVGGRMP